MNSVGDVRFVHWRTDKGMNVTLAALSVLQAGILILDGDRYAMAVGVALAVLSCLTVFLGRWSRVRAIVLTALAAAIVINFGGHLWRTTPPLPHRVAHLSVAVLYGALGVGELARSILKVRLARALMVCLSLAFAIIVGEAVLDRVAPPPPTSAQVVWIGDAGKPHPVLGQYDVPNSTAKTLYPDNPRGYFHEDSPPTWILETHDPGSVAGLEAGGRSAPMRVRISSAEKPTVYNIQLRQPGLRVQANEPYQLGFRARADGPRQIGFGISLGHAPWEGLGFYSNLAIDRDWKEFSQTLVLNRGDANAQLHFDLGASAESVELENILLRHLPGGEAVAPPVQPTTYSVTYTFNSLGCRGPDYPIPRPLDRTRILAIGDSYTLGVGVHQSDTFAARLEALLNTSTGPSRDPKYEVINCGVSGYATREERLFYELIGAQYEPNLVLLTMIDNDDMSWVDEVRLGYAHQASRYESLLLSARLLQNARHEGRRTYDYSASMKELVALFEACTARHARLAVVLFRNFQGPPWDVLQAAVTSTLAGTSVPILDLGPSLFREHSVGDLIVHPIDNHPNETAHAIAAQEIERFLRDKKMID